MIGVLSPAAGHVGGCSDVNSVSATEAGRFIACEPAAVGRFILACLAAGLSEGASLAVGLPLEGTIGLPFNVVL